MATRFRERIMCTGPLLALFLLAIAAAGCGTGERARREAEMAALVKQVEELKKGQEQIGKDVGKLAGEMKALDATNEKVAALSVPPPVPVVAPKPAAPAAGREVTAEKLYATAMASFRA